MLRLPTWFCAASPWLMFTVTVLLAFHIRIGLGHWPEPMVDDYDSTAFHIHEQFHGVIIFWTVFGSIPAWIVLCLFKRFRLSAIEHTKQLALFSLGWVAFILACKFDPTGFVEWFLD